MFVDPDLHEIRIFESLDPDPHSDLDSKFSLSFHYVKNTKFLVFIKKKSSSGSWSEASCVSKPFFRSRIKWMRIRNPGSEDLDWLVLRTWSPLKKRGRMRRWGCYAWQILKEAREAALEDSWGRKAGYGRGGSRSPAPSPAPRYTAHISLQASHTHYTKVFQIPIPSDP